MKFPEFPPTTKSLVDDFHHADGVVGYMWAEADVPPMTRVQTHRAAAIAVIELIQASVAFHHPPNDKSAAQAMIPQLISPLTFLGRYWDPASRQLLIRKQMLGSQHSAYFRAEDTPIPQNEVSVPDDLDHGYAYAFTDPPYGLRIDGPAVQQLFDAMNATLLPCLWSPETYIFRWPTAWSHYFDEGAEWWGTFLWTIEQPALPILCIVASATD